MFNSRDLIQEAFHSQTISIPSELKVLIKTKRDSLDKAFNAALDSLARVTRAKDKIEILSSKIKSLESGDPSSEIAAEINSCKTELELFERKIPILEDNYEDASARFVIELKGINGLLHQAVQPELARIATSMENILNYFYLSAKSAFEPARSSDYYHLYWPTIKQYLIEADGRFVNVLGISSQMNKLLLIMDKLSCGQNPLTWTPGKGYQLI
jgi:hypothetical protein